MKDIEKELAMQRIKVLQETKEGLTNSINYLLANPKSDKDLVEKRKKEHGKLEDAFDDLIIFEANVLIDSCGR